MEKIIIPVVVVQLGTGAKKRTQKKKTPRGNPPVTSQNKRKMLTRALMGWNLLK